MSPEEVEAELAKVLRERDDLAERCAELNPLTIRGKALEEAAQAAENFLDPAFDIEGSWNSATRRIAAAIRALND